MRSILFLHTSSDLYGADRSLLRTVAAVQTRFKVKTIACLPYEGPLLGALEELNVETHILPLGVMRRKYFTPWGVIRWLALVMRSFYLIKKLCVKENVQLIHSNTSAVFVGGLVAKRLKIPHLWHLREIIVNPVIIRKFIAWLYSKYATRVLGVSNSTIQHLVRDQPEITAKSEVVNNGIRLEDYDFKGQSSLRAKLKLKKEECLVGMIGRVSHWKGQDLFLDVATKVIPNYKHVKFLALGSPFQGQEELMKQFQRAVEDSNLNDRFFIHAFSSDVSEYLKAFDIFILPSKLPDPFPTTVLEAMAFGKAIVGNSHGGIEDMIASEEEGILIDPPNDVLNMAKAVEKLIEDSDLRKLYGSKASLKLRNNFLYRNYEEQITTLFGAYLKSDSSFVHS